MVDVDAQEALHGLIGGPTNGCCRCMPQRSRLPSSPQRSNTLLMCYLPHNRKDVDSAPATTPCSLEFSQGAFQTTYPCQDLSKAIRKVIDMERVCF